MNIRRFCQTACTLGLAVSFLPSAGQAGNDTPNGTPPPAIRVAPPAPVFADGERAAELAQRRAKVAEKIGPGGMLVLFSTEPRVYTNDVDYEYRQENNLYYLTHLKQKGAILALLPGNTVTPEILFLPRRDPRTETWNGRMYSPQEAQRRSGVNEIWAVSEFKPFMEALKARKPYRPQASNILLSSVKADASDATAHTATLGYDKLFAAMSEGQATLYLLAPGRDEREYRAEKAFAQQFADKTIGLKVENAHALFGPLRLVKSDSELKRLQHAIDITGEAFGRSMAVAGRVKWEYEVEAEVEYTFKRRNADFWGYPSIVGCGPNATTLHYETSQGPIVPNSLLLMDIGAEYDHYTADITRTFPVNGKFTKEQTDVYQAVYDAQEAVGAITKPGVTFGALQEAANEVIKDRLLKMGLITDKNSEQYRLWFMHGLGHWLGMNVHDVGSYGVKLVPGIVFTNEPGIYIREDALDYGTPNGWNAADWEKFKTAIRPAFEKYKNIGVRIEDDLLVTPNGVEWMTRNIPRSIPDVESAIARARTELQAHTPLPLRPDAQLSFMVNDTPAATPAWAVWNANGHTARRGYHINIGAARVLPAHDHTAE